VSFSSAAFPVGYYFADLNLKSILYINMNPGEGRNRRLCPVKCTFYI
jgi:hypothetical protein